MLNAYVNPQPPPDKGKMERGSVDASSLHFSFVWGGGGVGGAAMHGPKGLRTEQPSRDLLHH